MIIWQWGRRHRSEVRHATRPLWRRILMARHREPGNPLTGVLCRGMLEVMHKTPLIVLMPLLILGGTINAAEQAKPRPAAKPLSACALVTKAEIAEVIGTAIGDGKPMKDRTMDICAFTTPKGDKVGIFVTRSPAKRDLSKALDQARKAMPIATVREVPGLGDKALLVDLPTARHAAQRVPGRRHSCRVGLGSRPRRDGRYRQGGCRGREDCTKSIQALLTTRLSRVCPFPPLNARPILSLFGRRITVLGASLPQWNGKAF